MKARGEIDRIAGGPRRKAATSSIAALPLASAPFAAGGTVAPNERSRASRLRALTDQAMARLEDVMRLEPSAADPRLTATIANAALAVLSIQARVDDSALREEQRVDRILELPEALKPGLSAGLRGEVLEAEALEEESWSSEVRNRGHQIPGSVSV